MGSKFNRGIRPLRPPKICAKPPPDAPPAEQVPTFEPRTIQSSIFGDDLDPSNPNSCFANVTLQFITNDPWHWSAAPADWIGCYQEGMSADLYADQTSGLYWMVVQWKSAEHETRLQTGLTQAGPLWPGNLDFNPCLTSNPIITGRIILAGYL
jgi:hypothetical protein